MPRHTPWPNPTPPFLPPPRSGRRRALRLVIVGIVLLLAAAWFWQRIASRHPKAGNPFARAGAMAAQPATAATARTQNLPAWLNALGTVTSHELVNVMPRVFGLLQSVEFSLRLAQNQYRAGPASYLNVITAQTTLFNARNGMFTLLNRRYQAAVGLIQALGGSWQPPTHKP